MRILPSLVFVLGVASVSRAIDAQVSSDSTRRAIGCRAAAQTLSTGIPAFNMDSAVQVIRGCGDQVDVETSIAAALTRLRASSDTGQLLPLKTATFGVVDGRIYAAAFTIASDGLASPTARAVNLLILHTQLQPSQSVDFVSLLSATLSETEQCQIGLVSDVRKIVGPVPLPVDAKVRAATLAKDLLSDASLPTLVRVAARCLLQGANWP
jgi:hypothetical protein